VWAFDEVPAATKVAAECLNYQMFTKSITLLSNE
jgi:hypothetical protein